MLGSFADKQPNGWLYYQKFFSDGQEGILLVAKLLLTVRRAVEMRNQPLTNRKELSHLQKPPN